MRPWTFAIGKHGPDWFLEIVTDAIEDQLRQTVRAVEMAGFRRYEAMNQRGFITGNRGCFDWYIDEHHYNNFVASIEGRLKQNVWIFNCIAIEAGTLRIQRGYGYEGEMQSATELKLLAAILRNPVISIQQWRIYAGGAGYPLVEIAKGESADDLTQYLAD